MRDIEKEILSALMFDAENMVMAIERGITAAWFGNQKHGAIYADLAETASKTSWNTRDSVNVLEAAGIYSRHSEAIEICNNTPEWAFKVEDVGSAIEVFAGDYAKRIVESVSANARNRLLAGEDPFSVAGTITQELGAVESLVDSRAEQTLRDIATESFRIDSMIANGERVGLPFPWGNFQRSTFGLPSRAVTPLAGRDGKGKSRLATCLAHFWISQGIPILFFPFEDTAERMVSNTAATHGQYDMFTIRRGHLPPGFLDSHAKSLDEVSMMPLFVNDVPTTAERMVSTIARHKRNHGIEGVVIDGFKDIIASDGENRTQQESHMMSVLVRAAKKYDVSILVVMHLTKIDDGQWIGKGAIKGSGAQTQSARMALMYQDSGIPPSITSKYEDSLDGCAVLDCQKASYGTKDYVVLRPELERGTFKEITAREYNK
ncbi:MAG: AAA family ATPase [Deltaproteobacteria bacterium]|nr:AAA family ATPase [Deltaproteobacteria bacterium]